MSEINITKIENSIYRIRGHKVMLDSDLARLYGVDTKMLMEAVKRNLLRLPTDKMAIFTSRF
ncbi:MAG: ORF6N domain-containing protein [Bacteriovoracaceae bacterium]